MNGALASSRFAISATKSPYRRVLLTGLIESLDRQADAECAQDQREVSGGQR